MRAVIQRVTSADMVIEGIPTRHIDKGLVVFLGVMKNDTSDNIVYLSKKIVDLRIFTDENDKLNLSLRDIHGDLLIISNFTLSADCRHGRRPSFENASKPPEAEILYSDFVKTISSEEGLGKIMTGEFGAHMTITAVNDGPVTIIMDTSVIAPH
jgi:D-tyrosyl-tRNA(Tyr) deacylase